MIDELIIKLMFPSKKWYTQVGLIFFHEFEFECVGESLLATVLICVESLTRMMSRDKNSAKVLLSIRAKIFPIKSSCALFLFSFLIAKRWIHGEVIALSSFRFGDAFSRLRWKISRQVFRGGGFLEGEREKKQLSLCHGWLTKTNVRRSYQVKSGIPLLRGRKTGPERWKRKENLATFFFFFIPLQSCIVYEY